MPRRSHPAGFFLRSRRQDSSASGCRLDRRAVSAEGPPSHPRDETIRREGRAVGKVKYDCLKCPGYCCSYPNIHAKPADIKRLAEHFGVTAEQAEKRYTKNGFKEAGMDKRPRVQIGRASWRERVGQYG